jgi:hypothetical protein
MTRYALWICHAILLLCCLGVSASVSAQQAKPKPGAMPPPIGNAAAGSTTSDPADPSGGAADETRGRAAALRVLAESVEATCARRIDALPRTADLTTYDPASLYTALGDICLVLGPNTAPVAPPTTAGMRHFVNIIPFKDPALAGIAVQVDPRTVAEIGAWVRARLEAQQLAIAGDTGLLGRIYESAGTLAGVKTSVTALTLGGGFAGELLIKGLEGLAKLIIDRARYEAIGWFLDTLGKQLCADGAGRLGFEMSTYWLPRVCALANEQHLWEYGAGTALWESLQADVRSDVRGLPGAAAGLSVALVHTADVRSPSGPYTEPPDATFTPFSCGDSANPSTTCKVSMSVRKDTSELTRSLLQGRDAPTALAQWASGIDATLATHAKDPRRLRLVTCAASIPKFIADFREPFKNAGLGRRQLAFAAVLGQPSCVLALVPHKHKRACLALDDGKPTGLGTCDVAGLADGFELLTSLSGRSDLYANATKLESAIKDLETSMEVFAKAKGEKLEVKIDAVFDLALSSLSVCTAGLDLFATGGGAYLDQIRRARDAVEGLRRVIGVARPAARQEWAEAVTAFRDFLEFLEANDAFGVMTTRDISIRGHFQEVTRHVAVFVTILNAKNGDEVAEALDKLADPPGGWRTKSNPALGVLSITAHPGLFTAGELRVGPYGAFRENGEKAYFQGPTLSLPVGLEYTSGLDCPISPVGAFVSLIDVAAFLEYDVDQGGRLPGPSVLTVLAPGLGLRLGVKDTPFSFLPYFVVRPGLRQWEPDPDGAGATALQLGGLFSVDVTLFSLATWQREVVK